MLVTSIFSFFHNVFYPFQYTKNPIQFKCLIDHNAIYPPFDKILKGTKLKAFADDKMNVAEMTISLYDRIENTVGKEENAGYQHFLLFPQCFPKPSFLGYLKGRIVW